MGNENVSFTCPRQIAEMIENSPIAAVVTDPHLPDNPIVACNEAFLQLTGYGRDEVVGRNCRFMAGPDQGPLLVEEMQDAVRNRHPLLAEVVNFKKDGTRFVNALMIAPVFGPDGELQYFLGSQAEVGSSAEPAHSETRARLERLPVRQRQVLTGVLQGKRNKVVAHELGISERTVKLHRAALLDSLGVKTVAEAIRLAAEAGWPEGNSERGG
jgi:PAS domain S-box-containing protein